MKIEKYRHSNNIDEFEKVLKPTVKGSRVELSGYISAKKRIENLISAGMRLVESRNALYDFNEDDALDENIEFPSPRRMNYVMAEASMQKAAVSHRLKEQKKAAEQQKKADPIVLQDPPSKVAPEPPKGA